MTKRREPDRDVTGMLRNIGFLNGANVAYAQSCELRNVEIERISAKLKSREGNIQLGVAERSSIKSVTSFSLQFRARACFPFVI
jgi:hypothetical protein